MTGLNPGRHGIWDFGHITPGTYVVEPTTGAQRHGASLWEIADECGLRSVVANVPLSYPCRPIRGVYVPGLGATSLDGTTHPRNIGRLIEQTVPEYRIDSNAYEYADPGEFLLSVERMVDARGPAAGSPRSAPSTGPFESSSSVSASLSEPSARPRPPRPKTI